MTTGGELQKSNAEEVEAGAAIDALAMRFWRDGPSLDAIALAGEAPVLPEALRLGLLRVEADAYCTADEDGLVRRAARHFATTALLPLLSTPKDLFEVLREVYVERVRKDGHQAAKPFAGLALAYLHNEIDEADIFVLGVEALQGKAQWYSVLTPISDAVPYLQDISVASLFRFVAPSSAEEKDSFLGGILSGALRPWFVGHLDTAEAVLVHYAKDRNPLATPLFCCALETVVQEDLPAGITLIAQYCAAEHDEIAVSAMTVIGNLNWPDGSDAAFSDAMALVRAALQPPHDRLYTPATSTMAALIARKPEHQGELATLASTGTLEALRAVSKFLLVNGRQFRGQDWFTELAMQCVPAVEDGLTLSNMDMVLHDWVGDSQLQVPLINWLDRWIGAQECRAVREWDGEGILSYTLHEIMGHEALLSRLVTDWLFRKELQYPLFVEEMLQMPALGQHFTLAFDNACVDRLDEKDIMLLVRRTLGYVSFESIVRSLLWSLTSTQAPEARTFNLVAQVFVEHIGYDYPADTRTFLIDKRNAAGDATPLAALCTQIIEQLDAYEAQLEALPPLKELQPAYQKRVLLGRKRWRQQNEARKKAEVNSILPQIATRIPLKAGASSFSFMMGRYSEKMYLKKFSHGIAIPRSAIIDDIGTHFDRLSLRFSQRDS